MHPIPGKVRRGYSGGTAFRGDGVRVFKQLAWLEGGSAKVALSRPTHANATGIPQEHAGQAASRWVCVTNRTGNGDGLLLPFMIIFVLYLGLQKCK
jgi:hypothetical protein